MKDVVSTKFHYFKIVLPASPYIIIPPGGIIIYEIAEGSILKKRNVVDPSYRYNQKSVTRKRPIRLALPLYWVCSLDE